MLTLFLNPNEWAIDQLTGVVKIDRFLDTQFASYDRFWYPLAGTTVDGDRQFYVIELERRGSGLLFPARLNIERELPQQVGDYDVIDVRDPVIDNTGQITSVSPDPAAAGFGGEEAETLADGSSAPGDRDPGRRGVCRLQFRL